MGPSDLLRLMARSKHLRLGHLGLGGYTIVCFIIVIGVMFAVSYLGLASGSFGFAPTSGLH